MNEAFLSLIPVYGLPFLALVTVLGCLAIPVPSSLVLLMMGSLVSAGEFSLVTVFLTALLSAFAGDQIGFYVGRVAGATIARYVAKSRKRRKAMEKAEKTIERRGAFAIFLCHSVLSPLAPYANLITGAARYNWLSFSILSALGNTLWVVAYVGVGLLFSDHVIAIAKMAGNATGFLVAATLALFLGWQLLGAMRNWHNKPDED